MDSFFFLIENHCLPGYLRRYIPSYQQLKKLVGPRWIDALFYCPTGFEERLAPTFSHTLLEGSLVTLKVFVKKHFKPPGTTPYRVTCLFDNTPIELIFFQFRERVIKKRAPIGEWICVSGCLKKSSLDPTLWTIIHPDYLGPVDSFQDWIGLKALYSLTAGVTQKRIRFFIRYTLEKILNGPEEWLTQELVHQKGWLDWLSSIKYLHHPHNRQDLSKHLIALERLRFDEFLAYHLAMNIGKNHKKPAKALGISCKNGLQEALLKSLPFELTAGQKQVLKEINDDLEKPFQMLRLLQGDVGSGKTIVSILAALKLIEHGYQVAFLAPTDILCRQHYKTLTTFLAPLGINSAILTARETGVTRLTILDSLLKGKVNLLLGTHAIIQDFVQFHRLGLVIIDEQHRFGVDQRVKLCEKAEHPHLLSMTATPIPRTLMLAQYEDMDSSILREKPTGRPLIDTKVISLKKIEAFLEGIERLLKKEEKIFWVCPLVEESEKSDLMSAKIRFEGLLKKFPGSVSLIHGKMKANEKDQAMESFLKGESRILVATTVIEVGVDIPDASIMVIEQAERFGLSQLHQLRGRIGRGTRPSMCILLYTPTISLVGKKRLAVMKKTTDGFKIAEADLQLRGGGESLGTKQSGLPKFRLCHFEPEKEQESDYQLFEEAYRYSQKILKEDPFLSSKAGQRLRMLLTLFNYDKGIHYKRSG